MIKKIIPMGLLAIGTFGCSEDNEMSHAEAEEFEGIGVLISDAESQDLHWYNHHNKSQETFESKHAKPRIYRTGSGRYAAIIHRDESLVEYFDSGLELHGNHVDELNEPGIGPMTGVGGKPTHFKSSHNLLLAFNDEDGTLLMADEADVSENGAKMTVLDAGLTPHHGAMAIFDNGNIAVTKKTGDIEGSLPEQVQIIDQTGAMAHEATITTNGIHGNAGDGNHAVFGSASGILVVTQDGAQKLIDHPDSFGDSWFGSILSTQYDGVFVGYTSDHGVYLIDVESETLTPLFTYSGLFRCAMDVDGSHVLVLLETGMLHVLNVSDQTESASGAVISAFEKPSGGHGAVYPSLAASSRYVYVTDPDNGQLIVANLQDLEDIEKVPISSKPYSLSLVGHESEVGLH
ncbi:YncE family protein [Reichenbachiella sp.]|uniref:YncE family protein n=1 Tax=Reichenbachiella sp. TaxID=2184521 RepID=UPI003BAF0BA2